jgi:uncharacterized repeat protein (TIGR03803 family)
MNWLTSIRGLSAPKSPRRKPRSARPRVRQLETRLTPSLVALASFNGADGSLPVESVVMDGSGNLFGTAEGGGALGDGTVFELPHGSTRLTTLASFNGTDGRTPNGVMIDSSGNLYGTTQIGGASRDGTVFEMAAGSGTITTLASFDGTDGQVPERPPIEDSSGNLYGTTSSGGADGDGTVYEVAAGSGTITTLATFDGTNGYDPYSPLIMDSSGNLYGTTLKGGADSAGTVFEVVAGSGTVSTLASFDGKDGNEPFSAVVMDGNGNLYGTTYVGGAYGQGTVYELPHGSHTIRALASFNVTDGEGGEQGLVMDGSGNLYGAALAGGAHGDGTVYELPHGSHHIVALASFSRPDGIGPEGGLMMDSSGDLFGVAGQGGTSNNGTIFELPGGAAPVDQWTGANFAVDTNWSDGANWSLGAPPTSGQTALFTNNSSVKSFTATVDAGFTNAIGGLEITGAWGGTITVNSALAVNGGFTMASGTLGGGGAVTVAGDAMQWTGGEIDVGASGFTNTGVLKGNTTGSTLAALGGGTLTSDGTINEVGTNGLSLENGTTLTNAQGATYDIEGTGGITASGGGALVNAGTLEKSVSTGMATIATTTLSNTGTVAVDSGTLDISAAVGQVSGGTLTAGTWTVTGSSTVHSKLDITSAGSLTTIGTAAAVTLNGPNTAFSNLKRLHTIDSGGSFALSGGQTVTTAGALTDSGGLTLGPGSTLTVSGSFTQTSTGTLTIEMGGTSSAPTFGQLSSTTGTVTLAGSLQVTSTVVPAVGTAFEILDNAGNAAVGGTFAGLPEGSTFTVTSGGTAMVFTISYVGTDTDGSNNVVITRSS